MSEVGAAERPFVACMYDYYLGGTANTAADRAAVEQLKQVVPEVIDGAWANRGFLQRAVTRMAAQWGVRQFLDLGAGLPTQRHTHEVLADVVDDGRVVYVDNDPRVIERGRQLLAGVDGTVAIEADLRRPETVLAHPDTRRLIDFGRPVGVLMVAVTQFVPDSDDPWAVVRGYMAAVPSGSYLALSAPTSERQAERVTGEIQKVYATTPTPVYGRTKAEIEMFFDGLEIVAPYPGADAAVVHVGVWGAEDVEAADSDGSRWFYAAVARKP
jgi:hypothetical protein